jgi:flagellar motor switch protein FliM
MGGVLSQAQIDALLAGMLTNPTILPSNNNAKPETKPDENDKGISDQSAQSALERLRAMSQKVNNR